MPAHIPDHPYRGPGPGRPAGIPLPPASLPRVRAGRMLKRWRYVGVYEAEIMLCVGSAHVGPMHQVWWAVWDRRERRLWERTRLLGGRRRVRLEPGAVSVADGDVIIELALTEEEGVEVVTPDGQAYAWTRKQGAAAAAGSVRAGGREWQIDSPAVVDDSAGYHPRRTAWLWSAGLGTSGDGRALAWNLVDGIHDSAHASERTVWVDGQPREMGPVSFAADLSSIRFGDGAELTFAVEAVRRRDDNVLVVRSRYVQPFGTFEGTLPDGLELAQGFGVMERHDARW